MNTIKAIKLCLNSPLSCITDILLSKKFKLVDIKKEHRWALCLEQNSDQIMQVKVREVNVYLWFCFCHRCCLQWMTGSAHCGERAVKIV